eukprot:scaffold39271_cov30-Tisochrysis_lutea.AAC.3
MSHPLAWDSQCAWDRSRLVRGSSSICLAVNGEGRHKWGEPDAGGCSCVPGPVKALECCTETWTHGKT